MTDTALHGVPALGTPTRQVFVTALRRGWADLRAAPLYAAIFAGSCVLGGWGLMAVSVLSETTYWLVLAAIGFPLIGPFAAIGFYDISRRLARDEPLVMSEIFGVVLRQSQRQLPSLCAIIVLLFMFWFFLGHMIFALFLGLSTMTNVMSSMAIYGTASGIQMLAVGTAVGAVFALVLFNITVLALPMLLDREVDFVSAMLASWGHVSRHPLPMLAWAGMLAVLTFAALLPGFLGLLVVLPWLGHSSWHLYDGLVTASAKGAV
ncbi:MAG: DUF2189 domain-containing protein, partial [Primorskyibacter sp.]